jgi:hypothetical protein
MEVQSWRDTGLTRKQFTAYTLYFAGKTQVEIARQMGKSQGRVSELLSRAKKRRPDLPDPYHKAARCDAFSSFDTAGQSFARKYGIH